MSVDEKFFELDKSKVRILVTDDENSIREMLVLTLKDDGWNVDSAENGRVAFEKLLKNPYHIVLSDIQMPEMTGIELLEAVKKKFPHIEVVIMTSNATLETAVSAIKAGANDYLNKPFDDLSVVPRKMQQLSERIMLRQQNTELLKRLKKSTLHLKLLFDATRDLNGILDLENLQASTMKSLPHLFQDESVKAMWLKKEGEVWKVLRRLPDEQAFGGAPEFTNLDQIATDFSSYRKLKTVRLEYAGEIREAIIFENLVEHLSDFFCQEVRTCFEKVSLHEKIVGMANRDGLTMLYNHRYFQDRLRQELSQAKRQNSPCSIVLLDIDHFKHYNDKHGHPAGDALLKQFSKVLSEQCGNRESDIVARYGGEEFIALLPFTPAEGAKIKAERIREAIAQTTFEFAAEQPLGVLSASIGVATFPEHGETASALVEAADKALYEAKRQGRNRVCVAKTESLEPAVIEIPPPVEAPVQEFIPPPPEEILAPPPPPPPEASSVAPPVAASIEIEFEPAPSAPDETLALPDPAALEAELAKLQKPAEVAPPPPAPEGVPPKESPRATLEDVLKDIDVEAESKPAAGPSVELASLMTSIESAFAQADVQRSEEPKKGSGS